MNKMASYLIKETLFTSARSIIYRARRCADERPVVLKVLNAKYPSTEQVARLRREYRITSMLAMGDVIEVLGLERFDTGVAIVLEDFGGESLSRHIHGQPLSLPRSLRLAIRLADALGRVHRRRVMHKDINPSNIVWNPETDELKLIDFGLATELGQEVPALASAQGLEGTLSYVSPEATGRMNRTIDYRTDFYSLGVTLFELLTGRLPFPSRDPMELVHCHIACVPPSPHEFEPGIPPIVCEIVLRLMAKVAEARYQSAFSLKADLERCLAELEVHGAPTVFPLGKGDVSERFQVPQKLYGREAQIAELLATFERVRHGGKEMLLVAGYSGIGKSTLVHEVEKPIVKQRGYFISGKFDQFNRNIPYASLIQAIKELVRQLLTQSAEQLERWRDRILAAVSQNGQVLIDVIPEVEFIIGPQPPVPKLPPKEAQNRFQLTFERFLRSFAGAEHPLVVFLDDLQWADLPSLRLLERFMSDEETRHFLLIGAYRDNEVSASHPFLQAIDAMQKVGVSVRLITLRALEQEHIVALLADALLAEPVEVDALACVCLRKTGGNPFFLGQFLLSLHEVRRIVFEPGARRWRWDAEAIERMEMTDNVVDLMASKIRKLSGEAQRVLRLAACIGNSFDLRTLALVSARPPVETSAALWPSLLEGLVLPMGDSYKFSEDRAAAPELGAQGTVEEERVVYRFLHDRVQQAAYSLIPDDLKRQVHLEVGRLLVQNTSAEEREEQLFAIVGHLNQGLGLVEDQEERDRIAALNLAAGRKAQASAAHSAAASYFQAGIQFLGEDGWERNYELELALHVGAAYASQLGTDYDRMERLCAAVRERSLSALDQAKSYEIRINALVAQNRLIDAFDIALEILALLGIRFPERPTEEDVRAGIKAMYDVLAERRIEDLAELPEMTDPGALAAIRILARIQSVTYVGNPVFFPLIVQRQIQLALAHGNTGALAYSYSSYGILLCDPIGDIEAGYALAKLAERIIDLYGAKEYEARTLYIGSCFLRHWKEHLRRTWRSMREHYQCGIETGDLEFAGWALMMGGMQMYFAGVELSETEQEVAAHGQALAQLKQESALQPMRAILQMVRNLRGYEENPCHLVGPDYDEHRMLEVHLAAKDAFGTANLYLCKLELAYLFGHHEMALRYADQIEAYRGSLTALVHSAVYTMFDSLVRLAMVVRTSAEQRDALLGRVDAHLGRLRVWAEHAPMNHAHRAWLVQAERHRVLGEAEQARAAYYRAIALAREHEYRNDEALATELFAAFFRDQGEHDIARFFLERARNLYHLWGAEAKVQDLDRRFPGLASMAEAPVPVTSSLSVSATPTTQEMAASSGALDLLSVLKASQALSGEVVLTELLRKLMQVALENAGARKGLLLLEGAGSLVVAVEHSPGGEPGLVSLHEGIESNPVRFSQAIVHYVERTHETVVLGGRASPGPFQSDPYLAEHGAMSILCIPVLHKKKLAGVLYLENDLVTNAFTPERCEILELIAAQAAISLENAKLYDTLESRVAERTRELTTALEQLRETQQQLILREKLAALGSLTAGIAHEIKNPLNFVTNFAGVTRSLVEELRERLAAPESDPGPASDPELEQLLDDLDESVAKIGEHGQRADRIVRAMLEHATMRIGALQSVELNHIVRQYVHLALSSRGRRGQEWVSADVVRASYDDAIGMVQVVPEEIGRVVLNLVTNALDSLAAKQRALGEGFVPLVEVKTRACGERVEIVVWDNGQGIAQAIEERIFTPFFTTKPPGEGTGLGLSISHEIVTQGHGGRLFVESQEGQYAQFVVTLPRRSPGLFSG